MPGTRTRPRHRLLDAPVDILATVREVRAWLLMLREDEAEGVDPQKLRWARTIDAQENLLDAMRGQVDKLAAKIEETNTLYVRLAKQSIDRIEELLRANAKLTARMDAMSKRLVAAERQAKAADAKAAKAMQRK